MSVSSEVQRTLVKSPPELWAELSDPSTLARHLGELGEIRIVRTEPERTVDWEAAGADGAEVSGRVEIKPSGWGTRVTLSASRSVVVAEPETEPTTEPEPEIEAEMIATLPAPAPEIGEPETALESAPEPETIATLPAPAPEIGESGPRPRFFARLFRRRKRQPALEPPAAAVEIEELTPGESVPAEPTMTEATPDTLAEISPEEPARAEESVPEPDISAELAALEEQTTAVLTGVLDRLGAAHHRPFSRS